MSNNAASDEVPLHRDLMCCAVSVGYDFRLRRGRLDIDDGCCDMAGCINFFLRIDPACQRIDTFNCGERDTCYRLRPQGWEAFEHVRGVGMGPQPRDGK